MLAFAGEGRHDRTVIGTSRWIGLVRPFRLWRVRRCRQLGWRALFGIDRSEHSELIRLRVFEICRRRRIRRLGTRRRSGIVITFLATEHATHPPRFSHRRLVVTDQVIVGRIGGRSGISPIPELVLQRGLLVSRCGCFAPIVVATTHGVSFNT
jgi:hypothetical protein